MEVEREGLMKKDDQWGNSVTGESFPPIKAVINTDGMTTLRSPFSETAERLGLEGALKYLQEVKIHTQAFSFLQVSSMGRDKP